MHNIQLEVNGLSIDEEENTSIDEIFLEEVMMINEKLAKFPKKDVLIQLKKKIDGKNSFLHVKHGILNLYLFMNIIIIMCIYAHAP